MNKTSKVSHGLFHGLILVVLFFAELSASAENAPVSSEKSQTPPSASTTVASLDQPSVADAKSQTSLPVASSKSAVKRFASSLAVSSYAMVDDLKKNGGQAMVDSENQLSLSYIVNDQIKMALAHNFGLRSVGDSSQLADYQSDNGEKSGYKTLDPTIHFNYKMSSILGSKPYSILTRYYIPISQKSQANQSVGTLRTQAFITWALNPKFDFSILTQARLYMNSTQNRDEALGADSVLRTIIGPSLAYNFNDSLNTYYMPYVDLRSVGFQRAKFNADKANNINHELGIYYTISGGSLILNPAWVTSSNKLGSSTYAGAGSDSNTEYDLNLIAYF